MRRERTPDDAGYPAPVDADDVDALIRQFPPAQQFILAHTAACALADWLPIGESHWLAGQWRFLREAIVVTPGIVFDGAYIGEYRDVSRRAPAGEDPSWQDFCGKSIAHVASLLGAAAICVVRGFEHPLHKSPQRAGAIDELADHALACVDTSAEIHAWRWELSERPRAIPDVPDPEHVKAVRRRRAQWLARWWATCRARLAIADATTAELV